LTRRRPGCVVFNCSKALAERVDRRRQRKEHVVRGVVGITRHWIASEVRDDDELGARRPVAVVLGRVAQPSLDGLGRTLSQPRKILPLDAVLRKIGTDPGRKGPLGKHATASHTRHHGRCQALLNHDPSTQSVAGVGRPLTIACVLAKLEPGGAQLSVAELTAALVARGARCRLCAGSATAAGLRLFHAMGLEVDVYQRGGDLQWRCDDGFEAWLRPRLRDADVVHAHMLGGWWAASQAVGERVPLVATEHNGYAWPAQAPTVGMRAALERVDAFFAHRCARDLLLRSGFSKSRLRPALVPVAQDEGPPYASLPRPRLVFAGRFVREKGPDVLLEALTRMPAPPPTLMLGAGPLEAELQRFARRAGLGGVVRFLGWRDRPARYIEGATAVVVPSRREAYSRTAVLAMGLRVPVIGTTAEDLPATLGEGRGIVVPAEDPDALAAAIGDVLDGRSSPDRDAGFAFARLHAPALIARSYERAYRDLVNCD
jgi:glycosyltransferase involved in cell wall biosynthesis